MYKYIEQLKGETKMFILVLKYVKPLEEVDKSSYCNI
jgi:hypothetical protein